MLDDFYAHLKNRVVKDLYWLLFSNSPLSSNYELSGYSLFPNTILEEWQLSSKDYFLELDKTPKDLKHFVERKKNHRLGFYAESLLSYFLQTFHAVELLLQNFQVIEKQQTLGEIDFIFKYKEQIIHIECAVKYYLLRDLKNVNTASAWVGPKLKDNLELKLSKLVYHQLPMAKHHFIKQKLERKVDQSYLFLKGIFFSENSVSSNRINGEKPNEFLRQSNILKSSYRPLKSLERPNWLSATSDGWNKLDSQSETIDLKDSLAHPQLVLFDDEKCRFIVPDDWGM